MLSFLTKAGRLCDGPSRRELLTVGGLSLFGIGLPDVLQRQALSRDTRRSDNGFKRAEAVILLYLQGAPSHIDLWDMKPDAPEDYRGQFKPIATSAPGMNICEHLPLLARQADKFALVRSIGVKPKGLRNHGSAIYMLMTGHDPGNFSPTGLAVPQRVPTCPRSAPWLHGIGRRPPGRWATSRCAARSRRAQSPASGSSLGY